MIGAISVHAFLYRVIRKRPSPTFSSTFSVPTRTEVDTRLLAGAAIFGTGWGIAGFCPGPALTSLASGNFSPVIFSAGMIAGMLLYEFARGFRPWRRADAKKHDRQFTGVSGGR